MPSKSLKQHRLMQAVAHNPKFAKKVGMDPSVGKEFEDADKAVGKFQKENKCGITVKELLEHNRPFEPIPKHIEEKEEAAEKLSEAARIHGNIADESDSEEDHTNAAKAHENAAVAHEDLINNHKAIYSLYHQQMMRHLLGGDNEGVEDREYYMDRHKNAIADHVSAVKHHNSEYEHHLD